MASCLVCLLGNQTIPNIIVAAHFEPDHLLLISSPGMEKKGKSKAILDTLCMHGLDYSSRHHVIEVVEDSITDLQKKVTDWLGETDMETEFVVNLTGGTKLMSIAAYDFFTTEFGSRMVYVPIGKNEFVTPYPKRRPQSPTQLEDRLSVIKYLAAYGFKVTNQSQLEQFRLRAESRHDTTRFIFDHYTDIRPLLQWFRDRLHKIKDKDLKKGYDLSDRFISESSRQKELLERLGFSWKGSQIEKKVFKPDWEYLRGGWLEEYLYFCIRDAAPPGVDVQLNVVCENPKKVRNEFDVVFTHENVLYLVECKSLGAPIGNEQHVGGTIQDFLYKLGALSKNFGLTPRAFLATTSEKVLDKTGNLKSDLIERGKQFSAEIVPLITVRDVGAYFKEKVFHRNPDS
ncbi:MAG: Card1-like endonuclease domain-containing protein [Syntrophobacteraceae bacterium]